MAETEQPDLTTLTVSLLSAYFASNALDSGALPDMIQSTHDALKKLSAPPVEDMTAPEFAPAVTVRKSLGSPSHILSMIDGKPYKMLKRHLAGHGLTPAQYRDRYKLASDYPMVAKDYSDQRRDVAQKLGLGRKIKAAEAVPAPEPAAVETPSEATSAAAKAKVPARRTARAATRPASKKAAPTKSAPLAAEAPADAALAPEKKAPVKKAPAKARSAKAAPPPVETVAADPKSKPRAARKKKDAPSPLAE